MVLKELIRKPRKSVNCPDKTKAVLIVEGLAFVAFT